MKPLNHNVVAKKEAPAEKTASGILLGNTKETPAYAVVEAVGPNVKDIKKGDKIIFKEYSTTEVKLNDEQYLIVKDEDILATL